ncbi:MAG TPA: hypothetical protein VGB52_15085 [Actinomycetota bacterium]
MDPDIAGRASRITAQEWRVIALAIEGVPQSEACEALGIAAGTLESHKQAIRRKLGIPKGERFEKFVRDHFAGEIQMPEAKRDAEAKPVEKRFQDRRVRWLLRITLQELQEVAMSAGLRAQLLSETVKRVGKGEEDDEARSEVADLQRLADDLEALFRSTIEGIRARGADVGVADM